MLKQVGEIPVTEVKEFHDKMSKLMDSSEKLKKILKSDTKGFACMLMRPTTSKKDALPQYEKILAEEWKEGDLEFYYYVFNPLMKQLIIAKDDKIEGVAIFAPEEVFKRRGTLKHCN